MYDRRLLGVLWVCIVHRAKAARTRPNRPAPEAPSLTLAAALEVSAAPVEVEVEVEPLALLALLSDAVALISGKEHRTGQIWLNIHLGLVSDEDEPVSVALAPVAVAAVEAVWEVDEPSAGKKWEL